MPPQKPNIVLIVLDTHRVDRLGCYGYSRDTSPNIDSFARTATIFENAISPAQWTIPTHASIFSGEYPTVHQTIQASDALSENFQTLAEHLLQTGYQTTGFCNNPLVGVLDNGFRRGFEEFYNYGGTIPSTPSTNGHKSRTLFSKIRSQYYRIIDRIATPIQQAVATSPDVFQIILNPWLVPLWTHFANFKGDTATSIRDTAQFLDAQYLDQTSFDGGVPSQFIFLNLMGTHLPYAPPKRFIHKFAPIVLENPAAKDFINVYNTKALHWLLPLEEPYPPMESQTLSDMYDAEVAYQDFLLSQLFAILNRPEHRENTLVIIVSDHGEMLGEHQIMGHGIGVYQELVHVPLIIRFPGQTQGQRVAEPVSTTRIFHTILETAGIETIQAANGETTETSLQSLRELQAPTKYVFSEGHTPDTLITILKKHAPDLMERFRCHASRWAIYNQPYKLIRTENLQDDVFNYLDDPKETSNLAAESNHLIKLSAELEAFLTYASVQGQKNVHASASNLEDEQVMDRLRSLGYVE